MRVGFWKQEMGSLGNNASLAEVAKAKSNQQNPHFFVVSMEVYKRVDDDQRGAGVMLQP
jgi:hypothetical protein